MAVTKTVIKTYVGDTIQHSVPVTLIADGVTVTDMSDWDFRFEVSTDPVTEAAIDYSDRATDATYGFLITDEQTGAWTVGSYKGWGKLQNNASANTDEFTVIEATFEVRAEGVD